MELLFVGPVCASVCASLSFSLCVCVSVHPVCVCLSFSRQSGEQVSQKGQKAIHDWFPSTLYTTQPAWMPGPLFNARFSVF